MHDPSRPDRVRPSARLSNASDSRPHRTARRSLAGILVALCALLASCGDDGSPWVSTWASSVMQARGTFSDETVRQVARVSVGGEVVRVRLSNFMAARPLRIAAASVGLSMGGAAVEPGTMNPLTFGGRRAVELEPDEERSSDAVSLSVPDGGTLVISIAVEGDSGDAARHFQAMQTSFIGPGNQVDDLDFVTSRTETSVYWLSSVEVQSAPEFTIVAFGDSITEGVGSSTDAHSRYPDVLADELAARGVSASVVNAGIGGNRIISDSPVVIPSGASGVSRFARDALSQRGATHVLLLEGVNDLGIGVLFGPVVTADEIIEGYRAVIAEAHGRGLEVLMGTILPFRGATFGEYWTVENEVKRQAINAWIRSTDEHDGFVDFDAVMRDPADPEQMLAALHSGDFLHPNDAGYQAMALAAADAFEARAEFVGGVAP